MKPKSQEHLEVLVLLSIVQTVLLLGILIKQVL